LTFTHELGDTAHTRGTTAYLQCELLKRIIGTRQGICLARYMLLSARPSVCPSHGWISQNGWG